MGDEVTLHSMDCATTVSFINNSYTHTVDISTGTHIDDELNKGMSVSLL